MYQLDRDSQGVIREHRSYDGNGYIDVKYFFKASESPNPAILYLYSIPPGASEGMHTHRIGDRKAGSFDEFYYVIEGSGSMQIDGKDVPVATGDHVFVPNGVAHGIENTSNSLLRIYLVAVRRD